MNTAPQEIAVSILTGIVPTVVAIPCVKPSVPAVVRNTRLGRCVIKETGKCTGCPEHLKRFGKTKLRSHGFKKHQCRLHGNKDTDEKNGNFFDRTPG